MIRAAAAFASLFLFAQPALAQSADGGSPPPAAPVPAAVPAPAPASPEIEALKRDLLEQARREADERVEKAKEEMRNEVRAELATQSASRSWEEEWQEQKKKLDLFEVDGYLRLRPTLLHDMDLSRGPDPAGNLLYPRPLLDPDTSKARTLTFADMRLRVDPMLNISEDIRLRAQIDLLDNLIAGSTPEIDSRYPAPLLSQNQLTPSGLVRVRRAYGEVNTPVGLLSFGRMGDHWGLGMFHNDGNCLDCDYGDTVDRVMFTARVAGFYIVPMVDFAGKGPVQSVRGESPGVGQQVDTEQADDITGPIALPVLSIAVAKRDTDKEVQHKIDSGEFSINYGAYFTYRRQRSETVGTLGQAADPTSINTNYAPGTNTIFSRDGSLYIPDLWFRFRNKKLRIEAEAAGVIGSIDHRSLVQTSDPTQNQALSLFQIGAVVQGDYKVLDQLTVMAEVGFASGDDAPGMGNRNVLGNTPTQAGSIDGPQFNCSDSSGNCSDSTINNFRFNRDYRVDQILWREIMGGVTDAIYVKPGAKYQIAEGFDVFLNIIYSRAVYAASTPGGDANLGVEFDPGASYTSDDGFSASIVYGGLIPLKGLSAPAQPNNGNTAHDASVAHALRANFAVKF